MLFGSHLFLVHPKKRGSKNNNQAGRKAINKKMKTGFVKTFFTLEKILIFPPMKRDARKTSFLFLQLYIPK